MWQTFFVNASLGAAGLEGLKPPGRGVSPGPLTNIGSDVVELKTGAGPMRNEATSESSLGVADDQTIRTPSGLFASAK